MSPLTPEHKQTLLDIAYSSIEHSLSNDKALMIRPEEYDPVLQESRATFVTLKLDRMLRGCIGMLEAMRPLVVDVAQNAYAAAFSDPRFSPMSRVELELIDIHISILSPFKEMQFTSQENLISQLQAGKDGLILEEGHYYRGTFLPTVWSSLPDPSRFLAQLKQKAGLAPDYWSDTIRIYRYTTESFPEDV